MRLINGNHYDIPIATSEVEDHFRDPHNYTREILEEWESLPFEGLIQPGDTLLDIGANVGLFTLHVSPYFKNIVVVEPTPGHFAKLKLLTGGLLGVQYEQSALHNYTGKARFRTEPINTTMNTLSNAPDSYEVSCITLRDLCDKYNLKSVDLCKIDIEGSEFAAITTETVSAVSGIIKKFLLETHPRSRESQDHFKRVFEAAGYKAEYVDFNGSVIAWK